jgi:hypothetical protein
MFSKRSHRQNRKRLMKMILTIVAIVIIFARSLLFEILIFVTRRFRRRSSSQCIISLIFATIVRSNFYIVADRDDRQVKVQIFSLIATIVESNFDDCYVRSEHLHLFLTFILSHFDVFLD